MFSYLPVYSASSESSRGIWQIDLRNVRNTGISRLSSGIPGMDTKLCKTMYLAANGIATADFTK